MNRAEVAAGHWPSAILHVDMDAFYVAVEVRRDPSLVGRPVVVGGSGNRGVVAAASYEARAYGVRSAMPSVRARRLCPQALFLPGDHAAYVAASRRIMAIFAEFTPLVEPLSLDEAFLDVTGAQRRLGAPAAMATELRRRVAAEELLPCSVGVASTKFLAKLGSEAAKPSPSPQGAVPGRGVWVVEPGKELAFLHPLPVKALWGVGPATLSRLERLGVRTVGDLAALPVAAVVGAVGDAAGRHLHQLAHNHDPRPVEADREVKSIGHEETFPVDRTDRADLDRELLRLADAVARRLRVAGVAGHTVTLKVRYGDFTTLTRSRRLAEPVDAGLELARAAQRLFDKIDLGPGVRLLGVSVSGLAPLQARQLSLDLDTSGTDDGRAAPDAPRAGGALVTGVSTGLRLGHAESWQDANDTVEAIRRRFGAAAIGPAALATPGGLQVFERDAQSWGPTGPGERPAPQPAQDPSPDSHEPPGLPVAEQSQTRRPG